MIPTYKTHKRIESRMPQLKPAKPTNKPVKQRISVKRPPKLDFYATTRLGHTRAQIQHTSTYTHISITPIKCMSHFVKFVCVFAADVLSLLSLQSHTPTHTLTKGKVCANVETLFEKQGPFFSWALDLCVCARADSDGPV